MNIVNHTNGTWDRWTADTSFTGRPANIEGFTNNWNPVPFGLWTTGAFQYDGAGNIKRMGNSTYTYDAVSRLVSATVYPGSYSNGTPQTQSYTFDAFGNMQSKATNGVTTNTPTAASSNHLSGTSYDGAGNQLSWNGATYEYDKLSMMTRMVSGAEDWRYIYTADDERFWSYRVGGGGSLWTLRGLDGKALRSYNAHVNWSNLTDYVYREGTLASAVTNGAVSHLHPDHLGTPRLISSATGGADQVKFHTYFPFGEETPATFSSAYADRLRFTGHERDLANVTGQADDLDYMHARHASPLTGRFLSLDNGPVDMKRPQNWNRYAYVQDNPSNFTDPTGNVVDLGNLSPGERARLFASLSALTGDMYDVDKSNRLVVVSYGDKGSKTAGLFVRELVAASQTWTVKHENGNPGFNFASRVEGRREIWLDFSDLSKIKYGGVPSETFSAGSSFIHEALHTFGLSDPEREREGYELGQVEEVLNAMREEAGLPIHTGAYRPEARGERSRMEFMNAAGQKSYIYFPTVLDKR